LGGEIDELSDYPKRSLTSRLGSGVDLSGPFLEDDGAVLGHGTPLRKALPLTQIEAVRVTLGSGLAPVVGPGAPGTVSRILLIDDEAFFRGIFRLMLESVGHSVIEAERGLEGIETYIEQRPDLTIVDIFMPDIEGGEVIQRLKQIDANARIIAVSGQSLFYDIDFAETLKSLGAVGILRKLDSKDAVLAEVERVLRTASQ
jgi:CheY-like chemotaxis protein